MGFFSSSGWGVEREDVTAKEQLEQMERKMEKGNRSPEPVRRSMDTRIPARQSRGVEEREVRQSLDRRPGGYGATVVKTDFMKHPNEKAEEESGRRVSLDRGVGSVRRSLDGGSMRRVSQDGIRRSQDGSPRASLERRNSVGREGFANISPVRTSIDRQGSSYMGAQGGQGFNQNFQAPMGGGNFMPGNQFQGGMGGNPGFAPNAGFAANPGFAPNQATMMYGQNQRRSLDMGPQGNFGMGSTFPPQQTPQGYGGGLQSSGGSLQIGTQYGIQQSAAPSAAILLALQDSAVIPAFFNAVNSLPIKVQLLVAVGEEELSLKLNQARSQGLRITLVLLQPELLMSNRGIMDTLHSNYGLPVATFASTPNALLEWKADDWLMGPSPGQDLVPQHILNMITKWQARNAAPNPGFLQQQSFQAGGGAGNVDPAAVAALEHQVEELRRMTRARHEQVNGTPIAAQLQQEINMLKAELSNAATSRVGYGPTSFPIQGLQTNY